MKIRKIIYNNHAVFGNTEFDFTKEDGTVFKTILLVGENGTGKTTLLNTIASLGERSIEPNVTFECELDIIDAKMIKEFENTQKKEKRIYDNLTEQGIIDSVKTFTIKAHENDAGIEIYHNNKKISLFKAVNSEEDPLGYLFSKIYIKYKKNDKEPPIKTVETTTNLRLDNVSSNYGSNVIYANDLNISELLVDINSQDANDLQNKVKRGEQITQNDAEQRIRRFKDALNYFFNNGLQFTGVTNFDVLFNKHGSTLKDTDLSSGEKTILQYGSFFLKDKLLNAPFFALIDEPEQSLHPKWEDKILNFYKKILYNTNYNEQITQLFATTHSEYVIKDAIMSNDLIYTLQRDSDGTIIAKKHSMAADNETINELPTYNEIKYLVFNLTTHDYHIELFSELHFLLQKQKLAQKTIRSVDKILEKDPQCPVPDDAYINKQRDKTLPVYIRNYIDHPGPEEDGSYNRDEPSEDDLEKSIKYMQERIKQLKQTEN